jgi:colicin import membrane protein
MSVVDTDTLRNASRSALSAEPGLLRAGVLAVLVHVFFIALMIFGLNWKAQPPEGMVVDLWRDLSQPIQAQTVPEPSPPPPLPPKQQPEPVKEPVKQKPAPEPIRVAPPPPKKPDIPLKQKTEKPEPVKEIKPDPEDLKKKEQERIAAEMQAKEKAEAERVQREKDAQRKREQEAQAQREAQQAAARARVMSEVAKYKAMILAKIKSRIVMPPDLPGNPVTEFNVTLLPGGDILDVRLRRSSGYAAFDDAVERAIYLSKPLPLPPDPALFNEFRNLNVTVHYLE